MLFSAMSYYNGLYSLFKIIDPNIIINYFYNYYNNYRKCLKNIYYVPDIK